MASNDVWSQLRWICGGSVHGSNFSPSSEKSLESIARDLEGVLEEIRTFSQGLHPVVLSRFGLGPALRDLARRSSVDVGLSVNTDHRYAEVTETAVYYVVSEALANAAKHAHASLVEVVVDGTSDSVRARIQDDGIGGATMNQGTGLIGLVDRVESAGGRLLLSSPVGQGTSITLEIPASAVP